MILSGQHEHELGDESFFTSGFLGEICEVVLFKCFGEMPVFEGGAIERDELRLVLGLSRLRLVDVKLFYLLYERSFSFEFLFGRREGDPIHMMLGI